MDSTELPASSISFTSSSHFSNGSSSTSSGGSSLEILSLTKLSSNLEQLLVTDATSDYTDADITVDGISVGVHRCILAARSEYFSEHFNFKFKEKGMEEEEEEDKDGRPNYSMADLLPYGRVGYDVFLAFLSYLYTGQLKPFPAEVSTCVDPICPHDSCRPAIDVAVEMMYASSVFQIPELISSSQRRLLDFVSKATVEDIIPILLAAFHCQSIELVSQCIQRIARSDLDRIALENELPYEIAEEIRLLRQNSTDSESEVNPDPFQERRIRRIHKALDSDDVELVELLMKESDVTLDEACALHYAASYCDPKVVAEVLGLGLADVNLRNVRGYTALHVAAMRKEPSVIVSLLTKGARASDLTLDGRSGVSICRRRTRLKDYLAKTEQGKETNKDRICVDLLEREIFRNSSPTAGDVSPSSAIVADDTHMKLIHLENRVAFARLLFPSEARLAMENAQVDKTLEFSGLLLRLETLSKTVEMGRHFFPHCSEVLDKFMEDDLPDLIYLEKGTQEEQKIKRARYNELKNDVQKAFTKDKARLQRSGSGLSSSISSSYKR